MEVVRENFQKELPWIREAIYECDFVAIDAEFSGLHTTRNRGNATKTLEQSYLELRAAAMQFLTVQIGLATFKFDPSSGQYIAKPFNFYVFPTTLAGFSPPNRCFLTEASSLDFLAKNRFNFNKWICEGIHYMTKEEESWYKTEKLKQLNNNMDDIPVDEQTRPWLEDQMRRIGNWLSENSPVATIFVNAHTAYQRRLVHQEVRRRWPSQLETRGAERGIAISKSNPARMEKQQQQRLADLEKDLKIAPGFRTVIDMLSESKKPIVGHNIVIDLAYILAQFVGPLPATMEGYKQMIHATFPTVIDTKYLSTTANDLRGKVFDSSLQGLGDVIAAHEFLEPRVSLHYRHPLYHLNGHEHEAGYDAYQTGSIFAKLMAFIARKERARLLAAAKVAAPFIPASNRTTTKISGEKQDEHSPNEQLPSPSPSPSLSPSHTFTPSISNNSNNTNAGRFSPVVNNSHAVRGKQGKHSAGNTAPKPSTAVTESAIAAAPPTKPAPTLVPAPKPSLPTKVSYAAMANRALQSTKAAVAPAAEPIAPIPATTVPSPTPEATPLMSDSAKTKLGPTVPAPSNGTITLGTTEANNNDSRVSDVDDDDGDVQSSDSEHEFVREPAPETFEAPFTLQSSAITQFENHLHWGRSSHGNLCLVAR